MADPLAGPQLIRGPAAVGVSPRRFMTLAGTLAVTDFKLRFFGSALGYLWQLMRPLLLFGVLYVVFTQVVKIGGDAPLYPVAMLTGIVFFLFFSESTGGGVTSLVDRETLVRKVHFPRLVVPASVVLQAVFNLGLNLIAVLVFLLASGGRPRLSWLQLPLLLVALAMFAVGLAMLLSALYVRYRDIKPIWEVVLQILFYASPIFYTVDVIPSQTARELLMLNPFAAILQQARHAFIDPGHPTAAAAAGGAERLLIPTAIVLLLLYFGFRYFRRHAPAIAEDL